MPQSPEHPIEKQGPEETLEFLKRNEVRTMAKDVALLREEEAKKEREKIVNIKPEAPAPLTEPLKEPLKEPIKEPLKTPLKDPLKDPEQKAPSLMPNVSREAPPKKPPHFDKVFIRVALILGITFVLVNIVAFAVWNMKKEASLQEVLPTPPTPPPQELIEPERPAPTPSTPPKEIIQTPIIQEKTITRGFRVPTSTRTIDTIIIYSTYNTTGGDPHDVEKVIEESQAYKVALHYLIGRDGTIYRLVPDKDIAYHAGTGIMPDGSRKNIINSFSLGIELIYTKTESPSEEQYQSLIQLVKYLKQQYDIPSKNILTHNQIAPGRKDDPWNFDWEKFSKLIE